MFYYSLPRLVDHPGQYFIGGDNIILVVQFSTFVKGLVTGAYRLLDLDDKKIKTQCLFRFSQPITFILLSKEHCSSRYLSFDQI